MNPNDLIPDQKLESNILEFQIIWYKSDNKYRKIKQSISIKIT